MWCIDIGWFNSNSKNIFDPLNTIILVGVAQGVLLAILIFHRFISLYANRFLGALMIFYALSLLHLLLDETGYYLSNPHLMLVLIGVIFLIGPLHFLYAKHLITPTRDFKTKEWLHFLPFVLYTLSLLPDFLRSPDEILVVEEANVSEYPPIRFMILNWGFTIQMLGYMLMTILLLKRYAIDIRKVFSSLEKVKLDWLRNITYMATIVALIFFIENFLLVYHINLSGFNLSSLLSAIYVYAMGYMGISKSEVFKSPDIARSIEQLSNATGQDEPEDIGSDIQSVKKYQRSGLSPEVADKHHERLLSLMEEEEIYTNSALTLHQLAERMTISPHHLSEVINSRLNLNFFDFVNRYRVAKVISDLSNDKKKHLTLLALAHDAGFNSKSSFNTIFKKQTGLTPSEYRNKLIEGTKL